MQVDDMLIDDKLITHLEGLSCLSLLAEEKIRMTKDLQVILDSMAAFTGFDTDNVPECISPIDSVNVFRDDDVRPSFDRELILKNAPVKNDEFFIAPKTVDSWREFNTPPQSSEVLNSRPIPRENETHRCSAAVCFTEQENNHV